MIAFPPSADRVHARTDPKVAERLRQCAEQSVVYHAENPDRIPGRLAELDAEWDVERALETLSASVTIAGLALTVRRGRRWILLPAAVQGFFLQHALQGWCPPLPVLRRMGFRTVAEIEAERHALLTILDELGLLRDDAAAGEIPEPDRVEAKPRETIPEGAEGA